MSRPMNGLELKDPARPGERKKTMSKSILTDVKTSDAPYDRDGSAPAAVWDSILVWDTPLDELILKTREMGPCAATQRTGSPSRATQPGKGWTWSVEKQAYV